MPPVIIAAVALYAGAITLTGFILTAVAYGLTQYQLSRARAKARDSYNASLTDRLVMTATVDQARTRCYGRVRNVDGILFKATRGDKKQFYTLVVSLCGHEIDGVEQVMFGDTILTLDSNGSVLTAPWYRGTTVSQQVTVPAGTNSVTLPTAPIAGTVRAVVETSDGDQAVTPTVTGSTVTFSGSISSSIKQVVYQVQENNIRAQVRVYNGGPGQDLSTSLAADFPGMIVPGAHKFAGMAVMRVDLAYDQDAFPNGVPNPMTAIFRGAKIYDPRTGLTAWSENTALIARDWSLYANGGGCQASDLVPEDFVTAANACDVSHAFTSVNGDGTSTTTTRPMYTTGIACDTSANPMETLAAICESMGGDFAWPGGKLSVRAGAYTLPVATITGDWLSDKSAIEMVKDAARADLINVITPTIANRANNFVAAPIPRVAAQAYIDLDGEEYPQEVTLEGVTDSDHAGHIASLMLKDARAAKTYTLPCNLRGLTVKVGQNYTVNIPEIGLSSEVMRCVGWKLDFEQSCCYLTMKATSAAIFDPDATFKRDDALPNSSVPNPFSVPLVGAVSLESGTSQLFLQSDGSILTRVRVSWPAATDQGVLNGGSVEIRYGTLDKDPATWQIVTVPGSDTQAFITGVEDDRIYGFVLRFRNKLVAGNWGNINTHLVLGKSQPPAKVLGLTATRVLGALVLTRTATTEVDWANTAYEYSTNGGSTWNLIPAVADRSGATWNGPVIGALKIRARDIDTSFNTGAYSDVIDVTVAADDVGDGTNAGDALNADPYVLDQTKWDLTAGLVFSSGSSLPGVKGSTYIWSPTYGGNRFAFDKKRLPVDPTRVYNLSANLFAGSGNNRDMYLVVRMFRADGREYGGIDLGWPTGLASWGGTYAGYSYAGQPPTAVWTICGSDFGAGTSKPIPSDVSEIQIGVWFHYQVGSSTVDQAAQYVRLVDVTAARAASASAAAAQTAATNAQTAANNAQTSANSALGTLNAMRSNGVLDASEKPAIIKEWQQINGEYSGNINQANTYGIVTERDAYSTAIFALSDYLTALSPAWNDTTQDTTITPATDQAKWLAFYNARQALLNKISDAAGKVATWSGVTGSGKPLDNAGRVVDITTSGVFGARDRNDAPSEYPVGRSLQFKQAAAVGISGGSTYATLETNVQWADSSGGLVVQYAYQDDRTYRRTGPRNGGSGSWAAWVIDLDRNTYTGSLDATTNRDFQQSTDPGSAASNGDTWLNTSTGKTYQRVGGAWVPYVGPGSVGTGELGNQAATAVTQDTFDLTGTVTPAGSTAYTLREVSVTPVTDCVIEFSARLDGTVNFDGGAAMWWAFAVGSGSEATLAPFIPAGVTGTTYSGAGSCVVSFPLTAGSTAYFRVKSARLNPGPNPAPGLSQMRVTQVKR